VLINLEADETLCSHLFHELYLHWLSWKLTILLLA